MFNLIIGTTNHRRLRLDRVLSQTFTAYEVHQRLISVPGSSPSEINFEYLKTLPTLMMPETGNSEPQIARIGHLTNVRKSGNDVAFDFNPDPESAPIPSARIVEVANELDIVDKFEFTHTHWAVKNIDLYRVLYQKLSSAIKPGIFKIPVSEPIDPKLVAVMMPFEASFNPVYEALKIGAENAGMTCLRADNIFKNDKVFDDILDLIWRARVVIADLSGKNPNVFYETGITHTIGRNTILTTQSINDIPFDLKPYRIIDYANNGEGREKLSKEITGRLVELTTSSN